MRLTTSALCLALLPCLLPLTAARGHGAYHDRLAEMAREIESRPSDPALFRQRAELHVSHEDWQAALVDLERVDRLLPESAETDGIRGAALNLAGQWAAAQAVLTAHLGKHPGDAEATFQRARARHHLGEKAAAMKDYQDAMARLTAPAAERVIEAAQAISADHDAAAALTLIEQARSSTRNEPALLQCGLDLALMAGQTDRALEYAAALQQAMPLPELWMARRAEILTQAKRHDEARTAWTALRDHLSTLPNLQRGTPTMTQLMITAQQALGQAAPARVIAPPALTHHNSPHP